MHTKIAFAGLGILTTILLVTSPVVADAARKVTGKDIKNSSITGKDIKNSSITGKDIRDESLNGADIKDDSLTGADLAESSLGKVPAAASADTARAVGPDSVTGESVIDRSLRAADFAVASGTVSVDLPNIPANDCAYALVPAGVSLDGTAVSVSAGEAATFANGGVSIHVAKSNVATSFRLVACNLTAAVINPAPAPFDYVALPVS